MTFDLKKANARPVKEASVEDRVCDYARNEGWKVYKFDVQKGASDRIFIKKGDVFFIEFKRPVGGRKAKLQRNFQKDMAAEEMDVYFCNNVDIGKQIIDARRFGSVEL